MDVLGEALFDDGAELRVGPGKPNELVAVGHLVRPFAIGIDAQSLCQTCVTLRDGTLV